MSASGEELRGESNFLDNLPDYFACLSLGFKFIATTTIILMAGLVITTIKATRSLHKSHIIFIANVMFTDIVFTVEVFLSSAIMMIGFTSGEGDLISCNLRTSIPPLPSSCHLSYILNDIS